MSADEPLIIVTEELLSDLCESQLGVLILIISVLHPKPPLLVPVTCYLSNTELGQY